jgi:hypothetical protein
VRNAPQERDLALLRALVRGRLGQDGVVCHVSSVPLAARLVQHAAQPRCDDAREKQHSATTRT